MTPFLEILYELSHLTDHKFYPDKHNACRLVIHDDLHVQLEMDAEEQHLIIGCLISEIPPGKYQEEVLKHALFANTEIPLQYGILSYINKKAYLTLHDKLPLRAFRGESLLEYLSHFVEKALRWQKALASGKPGPDLLPSPDEKKPPHFGLTR